MPASSSSSSPGHGCIVARLLPPARFVLPTLSFTYPLKLISTSNASSTCLTVFILSYGGGLVSDDRIHLRVTVERAAKLCLLTQGSTKIFKRGASTHLTSQTLDVTLQPNSSLLLLPDPLQPFAGSAYSQHQRFYLPHDDTASAVVLDWVTEGRSALDEHWDFASFSSRNEFFALPTGDNLEGKRRLLLRDALILENQDSSLRSRMEELTVFATLLIHGSKFSELANYILIKFSKEPRIGGRNWNSQVNDKEEKPPKFKDVLWTAASIRGFVMVKASGKDLEDVRCFLRELIVGDNEDESEVIREFGRGSLLCLQ